MTTPDPMVLTLARDLATVRAKVTELEDRLAAAPAAGADPGKVAQLEEQVTALQEVVGQLADALAELTPPEVPPPPALLSWHDADADQAPQMLRDLVDWVERVLSRYPDFLPPTLSRQIGHGQPGHSGLPSCWTRHPDAVEELLGLRAAWMIAYRNPKAKQTAGSEWHERLGRTSQRLFGPGAWLGKCAGTTEHKVPAAPTPALDRDVLDDYAIRWAREREQLDASERAAPVAPWSPAPSGPRERQSPWMSPEQNHLRD